MKQIGNCQKTMSTMQKIKAKRCDSDWLTTSYWIIKEVLCKERIFKLRSEGTGQGKRGDKHSQ